MQDFYPELLKYLILRFPVYFRVLKRTGLYTHENTGLVVRYTQNQQVELSTRNEESFFPLSLSLSLSLSLCWKRREGNRVGGSLDNPWVLTRLVSQSLSSCSGTLHLSCHGVASSRSSDDPGRHPCHGSPPQRERRRGETSRSGALNPDI